MSSKITLQLLFVAMSSMSLKCIAGEVVVGVNKAERIVTDYRIIQSVSGEPIDYGYNETLTGNQTDLIFPSSPGCPKSVQHKLVKSIGGIPWLYHGSPPNCYLVGTPGSCPAGHLLFGNKTSHYAHCDCMCSPRINITRWADTYDVQVVEHPRFLFCAVRDIPEMNEAVFDKESGACHFLDTKGPCKTGEWLVKDKKQPGNVTCVTNCSSASGPFQSTWFYNWQTEKCELKSSILQIMPVSLTVDLGQNICEDGKVYSKTLQKCIPKSKAFVLKYK